MNALLNQQLNQWARLGMDDTEQARRVGPTSPGRLPFRQKRKQQHGSPGIQLQLFDR